MTAVSGDGAVPPAVPPCQSTIPPTRGPDFIPAAHETQLHTVGTMAARRAVLAEPASIGLHATFNGILIVLAELGAAAV